MAAYVCADLMQLAGFNFFPSNHVPTIGICLALYSDFEDRLIREMTSSLESAGGQPLTPWQESLIRRRFDELNFAVQQRHDTNERRRQQQRRNFSDDSKPTSDRFETVASRTTSSQQKSPSSLSSPSSSSSEQTDSLWSAKEYQRLRPIGAGRRRKVSFSRSRRLN